MSEFLHNWTWQRRHLFEPPLPHSLHERSKYWESPLYRLRIDRKWKDKGYVLRLVEEYAK